jgi:methylated-DNA-protein-cysteine methyltransferase-like protein
MGPATKKTSTPESKANLILAAVRKIPRGKVSSYGQIAAVAGLPRRARLVGTVLRTHPNTRGLPWHRVINSRGRISFPLGSDAYARQRKLLEREGVDFIGERINMKRFSWPPGNDLDEHLWFMP